MSFQLPPRIHLGIFPTRIRFLRRLSEDLAGPRIFVKHDDETGLDLSGNKVRKLEFLLSEAREQRADLILTCGGVQSNHCRATAVAARRLDMDSLLFLRGEDPGDRDGNLLLNVLVGAELRFISPEQYADRAALMRAAAEEARARGRRPYVIPEGGSNALGSCGYLMLIDELIRQGIPPENRAQANAEDEEIGPILGHLDRGVCGPESTPGAPIDSPWDHIVCATGSGGTLAGLLLGARDRGLRTKIWGVNVCDDAAYFEERVLAIAEEFFARFSARGAAAGSDGSASGQTLIRREDVRIIEGYKGPGYARTWPALLRFLRETAREDGLLLDPVYTGKAFYGLCEEARRGRFRAGENVLFLHTGGIFSLYAYRGELLGSCGDSDPGR